MKLEFDAAELGFPDSRKRPSEVRLTDKKIEMQMLKQMGLDISLPENLAVVQKRLKTDDPFQAMKGDGTNLATYNADTQKYEMQLSISGSLYAKLKGWAKTANEEIATAKSQNQTGANGKSAANNKPTQTTGTSGVDGITDPNAPKTMKFHVPLQNVAGSLDDKALTSYVQDTYGKPKTNLEGDNINAISNLAKLAGVKVLNAKTDQVGNRTWVKLELTVNDARKINNLYKKEQAEVNEQIDQMQKAADKTVAESFMRGFFKGAWNDLKGKGEMIYEVGKAVADPLGTANKIGKAIAEVPKFGAQVVNGIGSAAREFSKMTPDQMTAFAKELTSKGVAGLENLDGPALFEKLGEIAGTVAMEAVLMKGAGAAASLAYKAFEGTSIGAEFIKSAETVGQAVKSRVANFISDEAATAAKTKFFERAEQLAKTPNTFSNVAFDPELWKNMAQIAGNKIGKGTVSFTQFVDDLKTEVKQDVAPYLDKLKEVYRDGMRGLGVSDEIIELNIKNGSQKLEGTIINKVENASVDSTKTLAVEKPPLEGKRDYQVHDPSKIGRTIVDIDRFEGKILWEEKSATSGINKITGADETAKWISRHITKKFGDIVEARKHLPNFYKDAEVGFDFVKSGADPAFKAAVESEIERLSQLNPDVKIHVNWR